MPVLHWASVSLRGRGAHTPRAPLIPRFPLQELGGTEGHNTASIGGFVMLPPVILGALRQGVEAAQGAAVRHLALTHESAGLAEYAKVCVHVCACVVMGAAAAGGGCAMVRSCSADGDGCVLSLCRPHSPCAAAAAAAAALWLLLPSCD